MILSIGAVAFDPDRSAEHDETFYAKIDMRCTPLIGTLGVDTVRWWLHLLDVEKVTNGYAHHALSDAQAQVATFRLAWYKLKTLRKGALMDQLNLPHVHTDQKPCIVCEPVIWTPTAANIEKLFAHMAHGDDKHRQWLREQLYLYFNVALSMEPSAC